MDPKLYSCVAYVTDGLLNISKKGPLGNVEV
jgi:hypothetical protein